MNEPNIEPASLYIEWVSEMSAYVKSIDRNHLVSSGHANFANKLSDLPISSIDFGTWHGYPQYEDLPADTYDRTIRDFCEIGRDNNKPVLLEEFGYPRFKPDQAGIYQKWLDAIKQDPDCAGWLVWRLVSRQASGRYPADTYDGFDIHQARRRDVGCLANGCRSHSIEVADVRAELEAFFTQPESDWARVSEPAPDAS